MAFRTAFYALVVEVEETLRELIEATHPRPGDWWVWLNRRARNSIEHYWNEAREQDAHLGKLHYASLGDLTTIAGGSPRLGPQLAGILGPGWETDLRHLQRYSRDAIAHPGKLLISSASSVVEVYRDFSFAQRVTQGMETSSSRRDIRCRWLG